MIYGHVRTLRAKGEKPNKVTYIYKQEKVAYIYLNRKKSPGTSLNTSMQCNARMYYIIHL